MNEVKILVDGSKSYVNSKYEQLKKLFNDTDFTVDLKIHQLDGMSGNMASYYYLVIKKYRRSRNE